MEDHYSQCHGAPSTSESFSIIDSTSSTFEPSNILENINKENYFIVRDQKRYCKLCEVNPPLKKSKDKAKFPYSANTSSGLFHFKKTKSKFSLIW